MNITDFVLSIHIFVQRNYNGTYLPTLSRLPRYRLRVHRTQFHQIFGHVHQTAKNRL